MTKQTDPRRIAHPLFTMESFVTIPSFHANFRAARPATNTATNLRHDAPDHVAHHRQHGPRAVLNGVRQAAAQAAERAAGFVRDHNPVSRIQQSRAAHAGYLSPISPSMEATMRRYTARVHDAVSHLDVPRLERLFRHPPPGMRLVRCHAVSAPVTTGFRSTRPGDTLLHVLADGGRDAVTTSQIIRMLLEQRANPNALNARGETPVMRAVDSGQPIQLMALVRNAAFDPSVGRNVETNRGVVFMTALEQAVASHDVTAARILETVQASANGRTVLAWNAAADGVAEPAPPPYSSAEAEPAYDAPPSPTPLMPPPYEPPPSYDQVAGELASRTTPLPDAAASPRRPSLPQRNQFLWSGSSRRLSMP